MRNAEMVRRVAEALNLSQVKAEEAIEAILAELKETLQAGESITLRRFGSFQVREKDPRMATIPRRARMHRLRLGVSFVLKR
jgi:nucleoid DNA-binding protein